MAASHMGHLDVVKLLLSHPGVDVNALDHVRTFSFRCQLSFYDIYNTIVLAYTERADDGPYESCSHGTFGNSEVAVGLPGCGCKCTG